MSSTSIPENLSKKNHLRSENSTFNEVVGSTNESPSSAPTEGEHYWRSRYEKLQADYDHLQRVNQNLEDKLLNVVDSFERKKQELISNIEYEKSTLMADVNKLSTKLVDARIKLHDYEEKEQIHAAECNAPCNRMCKTRSYKGTECLERNEDQMNYDPNIV